MALRPWPAPPLTVDPPGNPLEIKALAPTAKPS
jgi:hypothetical protein